MWIGSVDDELFSGIGWLRVLCRHEWLTHSADRRGTSLSEQGSILLTLYGGTEICICMPVGPLGAKRRVSHRTATYQCIQGVKA